MKLSSAMLCDAAKARDGLLYVIGGGVTRIQRQSYPADFQCSLALVIDVHQSEMSRPHELEVLIQDEDGERLVAAKGGFQLSGADLMVGEHVLLPFTLDIKGKLAKPGAYSIEVLIDGTHHRTIQFWGVQ
jgi:hypothetical protein